VVCHRCVFRFRFPAQNQTGGSSRRFDFLLLFCCVVGQHLSLALFYSFFCVNLLHYIHYTCTKYVSFITRHPLCLCLSLCGWLSVCVAAVCCVVRYSRHRSVTQVYAVPDGDSCLSCLMLRIVYFRQLLTMANCLYCMHSCVVCLPSLSYISV
jgi:hypothetical protein